MTIERVGAHLNLSPRSPHVSSLVHERYLFVPMVRTSQTTFGTEISGHRKNPSGSLHWSLNPASFS